MSEPVLPLRDIVVFPQMIVPLFVGRNKSVNALETAISENKDIVFSTADGALAGYEPVMKVDSAQFVAVKSLVVTGSGGNHGLKTQAISGDLEIYSNLFPIIFFSTIFSNSKS